MERCKHPNYRSVTDKNGQAKFTCPDCYATHEQIVADFFAQAKEKNEDELR